MEPEITPYPDPKRSDKEGKPRISFIPNGMNRVILKIFNIILFNIKKTHRFLVLLNMIGKL